MGCCFNPAIAFWACRSLSLVLRIEGLVVALWHEPIVGHVVALRPSRYRRDAGEGDEHSDEPRTSSIQCAHGIAFLVSAQAPCAAAGTATRLASVNSTTVTLVPVAFDVLMRSPFCRRTRVHA